MAKATPEVILLKGDPLIKELEAAAAITPGQLVERASGGTVQVHSTAGGNAQTLICVENDIAGDGIDDAYAAGENVRFAALRSGDEFYGFLADGSNAVIGSFLESDGLGDLRVLTADSAASTETQKIVGVALAALDMSGSAGVDPASRRLKVEAV